MVAMLYFSEDGSQVQVEYSSTVKNAYFLEENQFSVKLDTVKASEEDTTEDVTETPTEETTETLTQPEDPTEEDTEVPTETPTEEVTDVPTEDTTKEVIEATTATPDTDTDAPAEGCGAVVSWISVSLLAVTAAWFCTKKKDHI